TDGRDNYLVRPDHGGHVCHVDVGGGEHAGADRLCAGLWGPSGHVRGAAVSPARVHPGAGGPPGRGTTPADAPAAARRAAVFPAGELTRAFSNKSRNHSRPIELPLAPSECAGKMAAAT